MSTDGKLHRRKLAATLGAGKACLDDDTLLSQSVVRDRKTERWECVDKRPNVYAV